MIQSHLCKTWALGALGLLVVPACFYSFDNPVEKETPGSIAGTVQLQGALGGQTPQGGHVTVLWTNGLDLTLNSPGKFLFQDLPDGLYTLNVNIPAPAANDYPLLSRVPDVKIPNVEGAADALNIGTLQVPASGLVGGTVSPAASGIVVAAFAPIPNANPDAGLGAYEGFSTTTDSSGHYQINLPAGSHIVAASDSLDSTVAAASVQPAATQTLDLTLQPTPLLGVISGVLINTGAGASAATNPFASAVDYVATANGGLLSDGGLIPSSDVSPAAGGSNFRVNAPAGENVTLTLLPPPNAAANPCDDFAPFMLPPVPVIAGYVTQLGQVTWLSNAALGANGLGPCAPADGGSGSGSTTGGTGGATTGGTGGTGGNGGGAWVDAGLILWDGGTIQQTAVFPLTADGGRLVAWVAGPAGQSNIYFATSLDGYVPQVLTVGGNVAPGTLTGAQVLGGLLLTFATVSGTNTTGCEFVYPDGGLSGFVTPNFPLNPFASLGTEETSTFAGELGGAPGAFVLQPEVEDAGIVGAFTSTGTSFGPAFPITPTTLDSTSTQTPIIVLTLIAASCDVADLAGKPGFCLAGGGEFLDPDAGEQFVSFVASVRTDSQTPALTSLQVLPGQNFSPFIYIGLAALPGQVAVTTGDFGQNVTYWQLSSLATPPGPGSAAPPQTDALINWDNRVLGLSLASFQGTAGIFLPDGGQTASIPGVVNGSVSDIPGAYYEQRTDSIVTAGVPLSYDTDISIWQLLPPPS